MLALNLYNLLQKHWGFSYVVGTGHACGQILNILSYCDNHNIVTEKKKKL